MDENTIREALLKGEIVTLECKRARLEVPKSVWETYEGGVSYARNPKIQNILRGVGYGENPIVPKVGTKNDTKDGIKELTDNQKAIIELMLQDGTITSTVLAQKTGLSQRTLMRELAMLQKKAYSFAKEAERAADG